MINCFIRTGRGHMKRILKKKKKKKGVFISGSALPAVQPQKDSGVQIHIGLKIEPRIGNANDARALRNKGEKGQPCGELRRYL